MDVLANIASTKTAIPDTKADAGSLKKFLLEVAQGHDQEKVYTSDMKKILSWYQILKDLPLFTPKTRLVFVSFSQKSNSGC